MSISSTKVSTTASSPVGITSTNNTVFVFASIAGIAVGIILLMVVIIVIVCCCCMKGKRRHGQVPPTQTHGQHMVNVARQQQYADVLRNPTVEPSAPPAEPSAPADILVDHNHPTWNNYEQPPPYPGLV